MGPPRPFQSTRPRGARRGKGQRQRWPHPVSIHAPTRGATPAPACLVHLRPVSIHAPARGATLSASASFSAGARFQSTRPRGARRGSSRSQRSGVTFQSTRPRGARRWLLDIGLDHPGFNPRAHEGRDIFFSSGIVYSGGFNPRAHEGRDAAGRPDPQPAPVSIHAPTRGATR